MQTLFLNKPKLNAKGNPILDENQKPTFEKVQLFLEINGEKKAIQVADYMETEMYFQIMMMTDDNQALQMKRQGYFMMKHLIINPKIDDAIINKLPWDLSLKIMKALRETFMAEDSFLELGVPLDKLSQE